MSEITNPHDKFFKEVFQDREIVIDFLGGILPDPLKENIDLSALKLDNNSYIDENLKEYFSDIVYNCQYNRGDWFWFY